MVSVIFAESPWKSHPRPHVKELVALEMKCFLSGNPRKYTWESKILFILQW